MSSKLKKPSNNKINHLSSNCSTSGYSSQTLSECDYLPSEIKKTKSKENICSLKTISLTPSYNQKTQLLNINTLLNDPKLIRTSTPTNLVSHVQLGSSLSTISSIKKSDTTIEASSNDNISFFNLILNFFISLFSCFFTSKKSCSKSFDNFTLEQNYPKILIKNESSNVSVVPVIRQQQASSFLYEKQVPTYQVKTKIKLNSFISSTPNNRPNYNSFMYIDEKEIYDNLPINYSVESSQTSFNKAKYTVNTEVSTSSVLNDNKIKSTPLLSSSPLSNYNNLASSKSISSSVISSNSSESSGVMSQTPLSSFKKYSSNDPIYSNNFKKCPLHSKPCLSTSNLTRPPIVYEDYLCDKEVESYFENPDYFDCYRKEVLIVKNNLKDSNYYYYYPDIQIDKQGLDLKSKSTSTSSGIMSGATSASISTLSSIKSSNSIMNYAGLIRQYKGESYC